MNGMNINEYMARFELGLDDIEAVHLKRTTTKLTQNLLSLIGNLEIEHVEYNDEGTIDLYLK